jgi:ribosomal protein S18 acetylase RimI-like enzyme
MKITIHPYIDKDLDSIVALSLLAWEPVFESFRRVFGVVIYEHLYPDWRQSQAQGVADVCREGEKYTTLVAEAAGEVVGFIAYELKPMEKRGEVVLLAVHPAHQNRGAGTTLNLAVLEAMAQAGVTMAVVETGGDESHAPARRCYEKAGYTPFPIVRYFQKIKEG